jgi:hypothetical protein
MASSLASSLSAVPATNNTSAVAWSAVFAGAAAMAALSLILLILGIGLGLSAISPWTQSGLGTLTLGVSTIIWLTATQIISSGMGGYLAGRLRTRWAGVHNDEVYFRDTAHGFLSWAVATLVTAVLLTSAIGAIVGTTVNAGASLGAGSATSTINKAIDNATGLASAAIGTQNNSPEAAAKQPSATTASKETTDNARKASATVALWLFVSLLIGAFAASFAAIYGGRQRDNF